MGHFLGYFEGARIFKISGTLIVISSRLISMQYHCTALYPIAAPLTLSSWNTVFSLILLLFILLSDKNIKRNFRPITHTTPEEEQWAKHTYTHTLVERKTPEKEKHLFIIRMRRSTAYMYFT